MQPNKLIKKKKKKTCWRQARRLRHHPRMLDNGEPKYFEGDQTWRMGVLAKLTYQDSCYNWTLHGRTKGPRVWDLVKERAQVSWIRSKRESCSLALNYSESSTSTSWNLPGAPSFSLQGWEVATSTLVALFGGTYLVSKVVSPSGGPKGQSLFFTGSFFFHLSVFPYIVMKYVCGFYLF